MKKIILVTCLFASSLAAQVQIGKGVQIGGASGGGSGTVTSVSVATANGFQGTVANPTSTPAITINVDGTHMLPVNTGATTNYLNQAGGYSVPPGGFPNPMTTAGDMIVGGAAGAATRLPIGTNGYVLTDVSGVPAWAAAATGFTAGGDLSGTSTSQTVVGLQGKAVSATAPTPGQAPTWNGTAYVPTTPAIANMPSPSTLITDYDFHDGSGTTISDVSGNGNNMTLTNGTPVGTTAPRWIVNPATGVGIGMAMGTDSLGSYSLPTINIGTSCETMPVLQNAARTVLIQYFNPPVGTDGTGGVPVYSNTFVIQDFLGSSSGTLGYDFNAYAWTQPLVSVNGGGNLLWSADNIVGFHTDMIVFPTSGAAIFYHDGQPISVYLSQGIPSLQAVNWVLGCNNGAQAFGGGVISAPLLIFRTSFWSNALNSLQVQQAYGFVTNNLVTTKGFQPSVTPPQTGKNQYVCLGDSQCEGIDGSGSGTLFPYVACALTNTCYSTTYNSALSAFGGWSWMATAFGLPGAGAGSLPSQVASGLAKLRGDNNVLHVADLLIGTNGLGNVGAPCATIENLKLAGWDVWVDLLFSLSNVAATDQANRDPYNFRELQAATQCGAVGVIDTSADAFIGVDGQNGTSPYWSGVGVHLTKTGQAYKQQLISRVMNAYYQANPNVQTIYSTSSVTLNGYDRYVTFHTAGGAIAATLPDCIGMVAMPYYFIVNGTSSVTLNAATVAGQTETLNFGLGLVMSGNSSYKLIATTNATAATAPGGCQWIPTIAPNAGGGGGGITQLTGDVTTPTGSGSQPATLANTTVVAATYTNATVTFDSKGRATAASNGTLSGITGTMTTGTMPIATSASSVGNSPIVVSGANINVGGSYAWHMGTVNSDTAYHTCASANFQTAGGGGVAGDTTLLYLCGIGNVQAAHISSTQFIFDLPVVSPTYSTVTNCSSVASPAVCGSAAAGSVLIPTGTTSETLTVNTTAVTANSQIIFYPDDTLGTRLSTTCNSTLATLVGGSFISARTPGTSFTITFNGTILTNGVCGSFVIWN